MTKDSLLQLIHQLGAEAGPQLRLYVYSDWAVWLGILIAFTVVMFFSIMYRKKEFDDIPFGYILMGLLGFVYVVLVPCFIIYTVHVFTTPELTAIKELLGK